MRDYKRREPMLFKPVMTLQEIADIMGMSRERIRQIEAKALQKLRRRSRSKKLKPFIEGSQ